MHATFQLNTVVVCQTYTDILYCQHIVQYDLLNQSKLANDQNVSLRKYYFDYSAIK